MQRGNNRISGRITDADVRPSAYSLSMGAKIHRSAVHYKRQEEFNAITIIRLNWSIVHMSMLSIAKEVSNDMQIGTKAWDDKKLPYACYWKYLGEIYGEFRSYTTTFSFIKRFVATAISVFPFCCF